ncbi:unnamed protein product [Closterium sp. NIES-53]
MAENNLATLTQEQLDRLVRQLEDSALKIATLTAERDSAHQQLTKDSVGQRSGVASDGAAHSMLGMERNRAATGTQGPRKVRQHVEFAATSGNNDIMAPMPLKPQRPPCFDPSQRGGPTVQSWVFTMNVFFDANYVESDAEKICYAVSLLRGLAMDWWSVQDYTSGFLALCEQVGYMHEAERVDRYAGGLKPGILHEIMLRGLLNFNEILALAEKIDILRRPRWGFYYGQRSRGPVEHATVHAIAANAVAAPLKGRCFAYNRPGHHKSECPEELRRRGAEQGRDSQRHGNASSQ